MSALGPQKHRDKFLLSFVIAILINLPLDYYFHTTNTSNSDKKNYAITLYREQIYETKSKSTEQLSHTTDDLPSRGLYKTISGLHTNKTAF